MAQRKRLNEQVVVITGASSGIGLATARMAAARGAKVVLAARDEAELQSIVAEITGRGGDAIAVGADVASAADVERIGERAMNSFGRVDTWFNNAGVSVYGKLMDVPLDDQRRVFDTNFWGLVHGCRTAVRFMRTSGGVLINMGSIVSDRAVPLQGIYAASKHAIKAYTDTLRMELEHDRVPIAVTLIKPGAIDTPYYRPREELHDRGAGAAAARVLARHGRPRGVRLRPAPHSRHHDRRRRPPDRDDGIARAATDGRVHGAHDVLAAAERPSERSPRQPAHHQRERGGVGRVTRAT